jgi:hypothetical protein
VATANPEAKGSDDRSNVSRNQRRKLMVRIRTYYELTAEAARLIAALNITREDFARRLLLKVPSPIKFPESGLGTEFYYQIVLERSMNSDFILDKLDDRASQFNNAEFSKFFRMKQCLFSNDKTLQAFAYLYKNNEWVEEEN